MKAGNPGAARQRAKADVVPRVAAAPPERKGARCLLTVAEAAERLSVSEKTIRRLIETKQLPVIRVGCSVRIEPGDLERYIAIRRDA